MTKAELIAALAPIPDEATIFLAAPGGLRMVKLVGVYEADQPTFAVLEPEDDE